MRILYFFLCCPSILTATEYSIDLLWVYRDITPTEKLVFPQKYKDVDSEKVIREWAEKNPNAPINVWFDSKYTTDQQKNASENIFENLNTILNRKTSKKILLKDVRNIPRVNQHPDAYSNIKIPPHFRADLLRIVASFESLKDCSNICYSVYADFNVSPMTEDELFDKETQNKLETFGIVLKADERTQDGMENSFHIIGNNKPNLLKAFETAIVRVNEARASSYLGGNFRHNEYFAQAVFRSIPSAFEYFYYLEGYGKLKYENLGTFVDYDEEKHGINPFKINEWGFKGKFESNNKLITKESDNPYDDEPIVLFPTKKVSKPKISGSYQ